MAIFFSYYMTLLIESIESPSGQVIDCYRYYRCWETTRTCSSSCQLKCGRNSCRGLEAKCDGQSECFATCAGSWGSCSRGSNGSAKFIGNWGLHCKGKSSCAGLKIDAIRGHLDCTDVFSCQRLEVIQSVTGEVNCKGGFSCKELQVGDITGDINCKESYSCEKMEAKNIEGDLLCEGSSSCEDMIVNCKAGAKCTAKCTGVDSCSKDRSSQTLFTGHWNLECTADDSCQDIEARCPAGKSCMANCTGPYSCDGANFVGNWMRVGPNGGGD